MMAEEEDNEEEIEEQPTRIVVKIGELLIDAPLLYRPKLVEQYIDMIIKKLKKNIIQDKSFQEYLNYLAAKKTAGHYVG